MFDDGTGTTGGASGQSDGTVVDGGKSDDGGAWREQNTRLRQELAEQKDLNRKAVPYVQVAIELQKQDQDTYLKLSKGEALTQAEVKKVEVAAASAGLTREEFDSLLDQKLGQMSQRMVADRQAETNMTALDKRATEELDGYAGMKGTPMWNGVLSSVMGCIENGTYQVPETETDPYYWAIKETHAQIKARHPELAKGTKVVGKTAADRAADILVGGRKPSASTSTNDDLSGLSDEDRKEVEWIRSLKSGPAAGEKFSK